MLKKLIKDRVEADWIFPLKGRITFWILIVISMVGINFYVGPFLNENFRNYPQIYIRFVQIYVVVCLILIVFFAYGMYRRKDYKKLKNLHDFIMMNNLFMTEKDDEGHEKITDSVFMEWLEDENAITVRVFKNGGLLDEKVDQLGERLQAFLNKRLIDVRKEIKNTDYVFEVESDERITLSAGG